MYFGNIISSKKKDEIVRTWVFSLRCSICGTDNPDEHQFCSSCGKPISKPQPLMNTIPAGAGQAPVPATPKGPRLGLILVMGGLLFLIAIIAVGFFVVLPLLAEEPGISPGDSSIPYDQTNSGNYQPTVDSSGSHVSGSPVYSSVTTTATTGISPPVQGSRSSSADDLIIGTWDIKSSDLQMQFGAGGTATLQNSASGEYATGSWEKISDGKYRLRSPSGTEYPVLLLDPIAGTMYFEDYSMVFTGKG